MSEYWDNRNKVVRFIKDSGISAYDVARISKDSCCCRTCKYFVQHYAKDGGAVDFGHCKKNNIPRPRKPNMESCGMWTLDKDGDT